MIEVPDIFELPLDGNSASKKWILWAGAGSYYIGTFNGNAFTPQSGPFSIRGGDCFAATQTFNDMPAADGRRILIVHGTAQFPGMPFNNNINFPVDLTLRTTSLGSRIHVNPVRELALLRQDTNTWAPQALVPGNNLMAGTTGEAFELDASFQPGASSQVRFSLRGTLVTYNTAAQTLVCLGQTQSLAPSNGVVRLQMLVDRGILEIFGNDGRLYMPMKVTPVAGNLPVSLEVSGSGAQLLSLRKHNLGSAWIASPAISVQPAPVTANLGGSATFTVTASSGSPLSYQWRKNTVPIPDATNSTLALFPVAATNAGSYDVVVANTALAVTSSVAPLAVRAPYRISYWRMEAQAATPNTAGTPAFNGVLDSAAGSGQGVVAVGATVPAAEDDLITFNSLGGQPVTLQNTVPPLSMFTSNNSGGLKSFDASAYAAGDGALFFPQDQYGNEFSFTSPFSLELFFKTHGDQRAAGWMELLMQGETWFRYGLILNEAGPGSVRFVLNNGRVIQTADLSATNYADGQWHYLLAVYDSFAGPNGQMRLTIVNADGTETTAQTALPAGFGPLPLGNDGNLFIGRNRYPVSEDHRTFRGLIDEVQIMAGVVSAASRLGKIPSLDTILKINSITRGTNSIALCWTSAASQTYQVQWTERLGEPWRTIATVPSAGAATTCLDTNTTRLSRAAGFYRVAGG